MQRMQAFRGLLPLQGVLISIKVGGVREFFEGGGKGAGMGKAAPAGGQLWEDAPRRPTGSRREAVVPVFDPPWARWVVDGGEVT